MLSVALIFINSNANAWHLNLEIDDNKAAELYRTNPNEPAIVQWKNSLQLAINDIDKCFDIETAISCKPLIYGIMSECKLHPNELLACNDTRLAQYPLILKNATDTEQQRGQARFNYQECLEKGGSALTC
jgi:hypothetical protein